MFYYKDKEIKNELINYDLHYKIVVGLLNNSLELSNLKISEKKAVDYYFENIFYNNFQNIVTKYDEFVCKYQMKVINANEDQN